MTIKTKLWLAWIALGAVLLAAALALNAQSYRFGWDTELIDMPARETAAALAAAGLAFLFVVPLIGASLRSGLGESRRLLWFILAAGLAFRLAFLGSTPVFEDDWYRYLWDGAVTAHGYNPYAVSPGEAQGEPYHYSLQPLAHRSGVVIDRINHSDVKTLYPPVSQGAFALAYLISPWSLEAWRMVCLAAELATAGLLLLLLRDVGRAPLWLALYWWNPVAVKELMNSAHMEAIVTPFVLGALVLALRGRIVAGTASLALAIGAKIWPLLLVPLILRNSIEKPRRLVAALSILVLAAILIAAPIVAGGLDETSGFVVYARHWRNNSAHYGALESLFATSLSWLDLAHETPGRLVRALLALATLAAAICIAKRPVGGPGDLVTRAGTTTAVLFLMSPSQFPWYAIWMLPFVVVRPWLGLLAVTALVPVYYVQFYYQAIDAYEVFRDRVVWMIWLPVWVLLLWEGLRVRQAKPLVADAIAGGARA